MISAVLRPGLLLAGSFLAAASGIAEVPLNGLTPAEQRGGWKLLFDGDSTDGWRNYRSNSISDGWVVKDGALVRIADGAGDIVTADTYRFFELSLEYRISKAGNSGVMFHVTEDSARPWHSGPEVQIQDNVDGHDPQKSGWLYQLYQPQKPAWAKNLEQQAGVQTPEIDDATRPAGQWNHVYLRVSPGQCEVAVNGVSYYYFVKGSEDWDRRVAASKFARFSQFGKADEGHICLQDHGDPVAYRNIKLRVLNDDGSVADPVDGSLPLTGVVAFPDMTWEGFQSIDDNGLVRHLRPIALTHAGDGSNRIFVGTQRGAIYVFPGDAATEQAKLFLDLRQQVHDWKRGNEQGVLGLAFHPDYRNNRQFYVYYSSVDDPPVSIVSQFRTSAADPSLADPDSEQILMRIPQPFPNHNGGSIVFGHDGYLYIALGDGGGRNDPYRLGQDLSSWHGSILRIDVDGAEDEKHYAVPPDNPFLHREDALPEIFACGFRNVWRLTVDRETGTLWAADVGQDFWEEINIVKAGGNYGWSIREASYPFNNNPSTLQNPPIEPIWEYDHQVGKSITGGFVYRGKRLPELQGWYLYADYVSGKIWALQYDTSTGAVKQNLSIASTGMPVLAFGEDEAGEVYYTLETVDGRGIYRFERTE